MTDPISDLLTRIRNAARARKETVLVPYSQLKENILKVLQKRKFIESYEIITSEKKEHLKSLHITLNPQKDTIQLKRVSKPGQRIYKAGRDLKKIYGGLGITVVSTSQGIMSAEEAKKLNIGGEVICEVF